MPAIADMQEKGVTLTPVAIKINEAPVVNVILGHLCMETSVWCFQKKAFFESPSSPLFFSSTTPVLALYSTDVIKVF